MKKQVTFDCNARGAYTQARRTLSRKHTRTQIKGFMGSGWWQVNRPEEMEEAHRGEWWEEMMRMMSAEWLASGTDPVRLSAKEVEDREKERERERERDGSIEDKKANESVREQEKNDDRCQNTITLWQPRFSLSCASWTLHYPCDCATSLPCSYSQPVDDHWLEGLR